MSREGKKIFCPHCRQESVVKIVKRYDGFTLVGEVETCGFCGREFGQEPPPVMEDKTSEWLQPKGQRRVCYLCEHYVVNPFIQKCVLSQKEVEALDSCPRFSPKAVPQKPEPEEKPPSSAPSIF